MGFLGVRFEEGGGVELPLPPWCVKLVRIMLETLNLASTYTPICSFRKYILYCLGPLYFANLNSAFFCKKEGFLSKKLAFLKAITWELCERVFSSVFSFCKTKGYHYWNHNFCRLCVRNPASGLLRIGQKCEKWQLVIFKFFWRYFFLLSSLVNIIAGSGIMPTFFYKGLTRNSEIGNTNVWVLLNIWKLGQVM